MINVKHLNFLISAFLTKILHNVAVAIHFDKL